MPYNSMPAYMVSSYSNIGNLQVQESLFDQGTAEIKESISSWNLCFGFLWIGHGRAIVDNQCYVAFIPQRELWGHQAIVEAFQEASKF